MKTALTLPGHPGDPTNPALFSAAANRIMAAYNARQLVINVDTSPPIITLGALGAASTINGRALGLPQTLISTVPIRDGSHPGGLSTPSNWIYGNVLTNAKTFARGAARRFRWTGQKFDFTWSNSTSNRVAFALRYAENGGLMKWAVANQDFEVDPIVTSSGEYILVDFGRTATWDIEIEWGFETSYCIGFNFDDNGVSVTPAPARPYPLSFMWLGDSYIFGQGVDGFARSIVGQFSQKIGAYNGFNHGYRVNRWAKTVDPVSGANPAMPIRIQNGVWDEGATNGTLDLIICGGTINDNNSATSAGTSITQLQANVTTGLQRLRTLNPNTIIAFYHQLHNPDSRGSTAVLDAYRNGYQAALGADAGAVFLESIVENWIPVGAIGSTSYFPAFGDTYHPNAAGHAYLAETINTRIVAFASTFMNSEPSRRVDQNSNNRIDASGNQRITQ